MKKPNDIITVTWLQFQQNKDNSTNQNLLLQSQFPKLQPPRLEEMLGTILDSVRLVGQKWRGSPKKTVMLSSLNPGFLAMPFLSLLVFPTLLVRNTSYIYPSTEGSKLGRRVDIGEPNEFGALTTSNPHSSDA